MKVIGLEPMTINKGRAVIINETTPASLLISGADVDDFANDYVFAAGSILKTADKKYMAFTDGEFTEVS